ncbi:MAG: DinB family protein [Geothrix sp.]|uniref:DinB family protein n=1 Tax=Geothrix sp. TaxID=1962974 RepID=UPI001801AEBB|nr:DinB family protein [Geothrix sp.]NWJ41957.1 DinB family protein [Geothrix sp.]WIL20070.1 MAG: DinB family protein [Geothrix sp.]
MAQTQDLAPTRLADQLERGFRGGAWHGPAVMELLADLSAEQARWRPEPTSHSIADLVGHLTYWLEDTRRQLAGTPRLPGEPGSDWSPADLGSEAAWQGACAALEDAYGGLRAAILELEEGRLDEARSGSDTTIRGLLQGTLQHNAYHAGQIALLRKQAEAAAGGRP